MFFGQTNPYPYILAAYGIGLSAIGWFFIWLVGQRRKLHLLLLALKKEFDNEHSPKAQK